MIKYSLFFTTQNTRHPKNTNKFEYSLVKNLQIKHLEDKQFESPNLTNSFSPMRNTFSNITDMSRSLFGPYLREASQYDVMVKLVKFGFFANKSHFFIIKVDKMSEFVYTFVKFLRRKNS